MFVEYQLMVAAVSETPLESIATALKSLVPFTSSAKALVSLVSLRVTCNETIGQVLADLGEWRWAPTFVFADQQAAEIHWETLKEISAFRDGKTKAEIWLLTSPSMIAKGVAGTNGEAFARRVDTLYGTPDWRRIQLARDREIISAEEYRDEMVGGVRNPV